MELDIMITRKGKTRYVFDDCGMVASINKSKDEMWKLSVRKFLSRQSKPFFGSFQECFERMIVEFEKDNQ